MKLIYNDKVENLFFEFIEQKPIKTYLNELMIKDFNEYLNALNICFLAVDIGISRSYSKEYIKILGYAGIFHNITKYHVCPEKFIRKSETYEENNKIFKNSVKINSKKIKLDCLKTPKNFFTSLERFNVKKVMKTIIKVEEIYNEYENFRKNARRTQKLQFKSVERRKTDEMIEKISQIIVIAKNYNSKKNKIIKKYYSNSEKDIILHLKNKFSNYDKNNHEDHRFNFNDYIDEISVRT